MSQENTGSNAKKLPTVCCVGPKGKQMHVSREGYAANPNKYKLWEDRNKTPVETAEQKKEREDKEAADKKAASDKAEADAKAKKDATAKTAASGAVTTETPADKKAREKKEADAKSSGGK